MIAAHSAGISTVILPLDNQKDLDDVPDEVLKNINVILVSDLNEVFKHAIIKKGE